MSAVISQIDKRTGLARYSRGLFAKFLLVLVPVFLLLAVPGMSLLIQHEIRGQEEALAARIGNQAARVADALSRHDGARNPDQARDFIGALAADRAFVCAEFRGPDGRRIVAVPARIGCLGQESQQGLTLPVGAAGAASLSIRFSADEIQNAVKLRQTLTMLVVTFGFLFAVAAAALGFRVIVDKPLRRLLKAIRRNAETGNRISVRTSSRDELSEVIVAFNEMLAREAEREQVLHESREEFKRLNEDLEARVRARTAELREREDSLFESEQRFRDFSVAGSDWYWEMDEKLRFSYFSDRFEEVTGVAPKLLLGKTREETGIPEVDPNQWRRHLHALHNRLPFRGFVHPRVKSDGRTVWLSISGVPHFDRSGAFRGFRGTGSDVTALIEAQQLAEKARLKAEAASQAKSEFLANMSHELRTPLNAIIGYAELMQEELEDREDPLIAKDLSRVRNAGRQLLGLINDVLDLSKIEAEKMDVNLDEVDLDCLIAEVEDTVRPLIGERGNVLIVEDKVGVRYFQSDGQKLLQILLNLIGNAAKFTESGEIRLIIRQESHAWLRFEVSDTGVGISEALLERVFDPFTQADPLNARVRGGSGLGLTLCKNFAEILGGRLEAQSVEGEGSCFTIVLPMHSSDSFDQLAQAR